MAASNIPLNVNTTNGPKTATQTHTRAAATVHRSEIILGGLTDDALAPATNATPAADAFGIPVRQVGTLPVSMAAVPTGAAEQATLASVLTTLGSVLTALTALQAELELKANLNDAQPVSLASVPLPSGAATQTTLASVLTGVQALASALPLPTGAATQATLAAAAASIVSVLAKLAAFNVAGTPSADVYTMQGDPAGTPMPVDGSGFIQPVSVTGQVSLDSMSKQVTVAATFKATTATLTNVSSSATSVQAADENNGRLGWTCVNDSTQVVYLNFGATASATAYTVKLTSGQFYEMPQPIYTGEINAIWASANGALRTTELEV